MSSVNLDIATNLGISCRRGDTFKLTMNITDSSNQAIDVTQYTFSMKVKNDAVTVLDFTDVDFTKSADGTLVINKSATDMSAVDVGTFRYDLQATRTSDDFVQTWVFGNFTIKQDIS